MIIQKTSLKSKNGNLISLYNNIPFIFKCLHDDQQTHWWKKASQKYWTRQSPDSQNVFIPFFFFFFFLHWAVHQSITILRFEVSWGGSNWSLKNYGFISLWGQTCCSVIDGKLQLKHAPASKKVTYTRLKNIKNVGRVDRQKAGKQGRDDIINRSVYNPTLHISNSGKICKVELYVELFYAIILTLFLSLCQSAYILLHLLVLYSYNCRHP